MKRLTLLVMSFLVIYSINPKISTYKLITHKTVYMLVLPQVNIIAKNLKVVINDSIFEKQLYVESRSTHFKNGDAASGKLITSPMGALGIAQFLPSTWKWLKSKKILPKHFSITEETHQRAAQRLFMYYLAKRDYGIKYNKVRLALAAYNAGSGRVNKLIRAYGVSWENHLPKETKKYLKIIVG